MVILSMFVVKLLQRSPSLTALLTLQKAFSSQMSWSSTTHHVHNQADVIFGLGGHENHWLRKEARELSIRHGMAELPTFQEITGKEAEQRYALFCQDHEHQATVSEHQRRARDGVQIALLGSSEKYQH